MGNFKGLNFYVRLILLISLQIQNMHSHKKLSKIKRIDLNTFCQVSIFLQIFLIFRSKYLIYSND